MEPLSILNPPITDILNDPRVTSAQLLKLIDEQQQTINRQIGEMAAKLQPSEITAFNGMMFGLLQHHLHVTTLMAKLDARTVDYAYKTFQLNLTLERLTKWLIALTIALGVLAFPLAVDIVVRWLK